MPGPQNKTVTTLGATCATTQVSFQKAGADILATAWGTATRSDGSTEDAAVTWKLTAAAETTVRNFMDGQSLMKLREKMGLEAP